MDHFIDNGLTIVEEAQRITLLEGKRHQRRFFAKLLSKFIAVLIGGPIVIVGMIIGGFYLTAWII